MNRMVGYIYCLSLFITGCTDDTGPARDRNLYDLVVAKDGSGDYTTVQEALDAVKFLQTEPIFILIKEGVYHEIIEVEENKNNIALIGEGEVKLTFDNYASKINPDTGQEYGTSGSSSAYLHGDDFYAYNITFENASGPVGQALAVYIDGDRAIFENCRFLGYQDTMYTGRSRQYFLNCYIEGTTDFIFGPGTAYFEACELFTRGGSAITAASTEQYVKYGYIFSHCTIEGTGQQITTLGRPWRPYAAVAFLQTGMSDAIKPAGWDNWGNPDNELTARFEENDNFGAGWTPGDRVSWATILSPAEAVHYSPAAAFETTYENPPVPDPWDPETRAKEIHEELGLL